MRASTIVPRFAGGMALILALLAGFISAPAATAQDGGTPAATADSSIEVHSRICPPDYEGENWYEDCHDTVPDPGLPYTFTDGDGVAQEGTTDANGDIGFAGLPAGLYTVTGGAPGESSELYVYCAVGTEETSDQQPVPVEYVDGGIQFELPATTNVICDWYIIPTEQGGTPPPDTGNSTVEIHHRLCPTDYQGENWYDDCHDSVPDPGMTFTLADGVTQEDTTNEEGDVGFAGLPAGVYTVTGGVPGEFAEHYVYCAVGTDETSDQEQVPIEYVDGGIQFDLPADTNVICDWYEIPFDMGGDTFDLPVYSLACDQDPGTMAANDFVMMGTVPNGCEQTPGVSVVVASGDGAELGSCATEADAPCHVNVPIGGTVIATEDLSTVPEGYVPLHGETLEVEVPEGSEAWVLFINVLEAQDNPTEEPTQPPEPGRALQVHEGACSIDQPGPVVVELTDLRAPDQDADIDPEVVVAETSHSVMSMSLDDLLAGDYSIVAYSDDENPQPVACTNLDGTVNDRGELVIGLQEVDDSGFAGIVYMAPTADQSQTGVSVFLAEGLAAPDEGDAPEGGA